MNTKMRKLMTVFLFVMMLFNLTACKSDSISSENISSQDGTNTGVGETEMSSTEKISSVDEIENVSQEGEASDMTIEIGDNTYGVVLDENDTVKDIVSNMPLELNMTRYAEHEYYAELSFVPTFSEETTSEIKAGHIYYWDGWNAFVINYIDSDISPYKVVHIGEVTNQEISDYLETADEKITVHVN